MYKNLSEALVAKFFAAEPNLENEVTLLLAKPTTNAAGRLTVLVEVDGTKTLEWMIADGKYDWKNSDINQKNYPIQNTTKRTTEIEFFHFPDGTSSDNAEKKMAEEGFRPIINEELQAIGAKHPELQREFPIVALGSVCSFFFAQYVPVLGVDGNGRKLNLNYRADGWSGGCRFPGVRKKAQALKT